MKPANNIETLIKNAGISTDTRNDRKILNEVLNAFEESKQNQTGASRVSIWRIIMKSRTTRFATAAMLVLAVVLFINIFNQTTAPAWAIEETIKALKQFDSLYISGVFFDEKGVMSNFELWAKPHSENNHRSGDFRIEIKDKETAVVIEEENITYRYYPKNNTVIILDGLQNSIKPFWPGSNFFQELKENAKEWKENNGEDREGKRCVFVTCTYTMDRLPGRRFEFWFEFDVETKLPVHMKIKDYSTTRGMEQYNMDEIICNPEIPDGIFKFEIPEGAKVIQQ
jgi:outer membrane lipoprotein-sorting protein